MSKGHGVSSYTQINHYANQCNPNNAEHHANNNNHANQCNPNNSRYYCYDNGIKEILITKQIKKEYKIKLCCLKYTLFIFYIPIVFPENWSI